MEEFCKKSNIRFNILLLLDNVPGHSPMLHDQHPNVRVEFLPPNTTSIIQPLDQEVISVVKASYSRQQFYLRRQATEDAALIQRIIDDVCGDKESEQRVVRYWKRFNVKEAVDLLVKCWNEVTPATINHAWRNILEGVPLDRHVVVPGVWQTLEEEVAVAVEEVHNIPGDGFAEMTSDDVRELLQPPTLTAQEILQEDHVR